MDSITFIPFHTVGDTNMEARKSTVTIVHASALGTKYHQIQRKGLDIIKSPNFPWNDMNSDL